MEDSEIKHLSEKLLGELKSMNPELYPTATLRGNILIEFLEEIIYLKANESQEHEKKTNSELLKKAKKK